MKKIAIIGASYLQEPLINKAKSMGIDTHVFAWKTGDIGERIADHFYPISIVEKDEILEKCLEIGIDGICSIASDVAVVTVNYVAEKMGLVGNGCESSFLSTNKHNMRVAFEKNNDPSPRSIMVDSANDIKSELEYPVIVKPLDRSGSRGIYKVYSRNELGKAIEASKEQGFIKKALVEEYVEGKEYSVECISYKGQHHFLAITYKYTTGEPNYIETGHIEPADLSDSDISKVKKIVFHALDTLKIKNGASHSEIKINNDGQIKIIEIGARMGGDFIGSTLVEHHTGIDFVRAVIQISLGEEPDLSRSDNIGAVGVRFICSNNDIDVYNILKKEHPEFLLQDSVPKTISGVVKDSSSRFGYYIFKAPDVFSIEKYMPDYHVNN